MAKKRNPSLLFDPAAAAGASRRPDVGDFAKSSAATSDGLPDGAISVSALVGRIRGALEAAFPQRVTVVGEISNLSTPVSGHMYFSLKDADATISAAMWKGRASKLAFHPEDGLEVVAEAELTVYGPQGRVQLSVERMTPRGAGALELAFRQLVEKLRGEGLFDPSHKKSIPKFPRGIGIVTSATGAAIRDIQRTLLRRWPAAKVYLLPSRVQGEGAAEELTDAVKRLDAAAKTLGIETIILARGGGSLEDLWAFNDEHLARAVFAAHTPMIVGVGHEVDTTIAELVADLRAATPTAAAELAAPSAAEWREQLADQQARLLRAVRTGLQQRRTAVESLARTGAMRDPIWRIRQSTQRLDELAHRQRAGVAERLNDARRRIEPLGGRLAGLHPERLLEKGRHRLSRLAGQLAWALGGRSKHAGDTLGRLAGRLAVAHPSRQLLLACQKVEALGRQLNAMSHQSVLKRGFSITRDAAGRIIRSVQNVSPGQSIETILADGEIRSVVAHGGKAKPTKNKSRKSSEASNGPGLFDDL